ncbi:MAG: DNA primase [Bacteroidales bacterium]
MIPQHIIEQVLSTADIVEIVGEYVDLKPAGPRYKGRCPFHDDKDPSFTVTPAMGICKCFACGEGGNAINFVMKMEGMNYPDAIRKLAKRYHIDIQEESLSPEDSQRNIHREALFNLNEQVLSFFQDNLRKSEKATNYLARRWNEDTVKTLGIGYAPGGWTSLVDYARENQMDLDLLLEVGLIKKNEEKNSVYDTYRDRVVFPIINRSGRVEGFTARDISGDKKAAKYINSSDSAIYSKRHSLFGFSHACRQATSEDRMYVVEGASDAMRLYQHKVFNTVAPLGTGLTEDHLKMVKKFCRNIVFLNDADTAGINAVKKHGKTALKLGLNVIVKEIPADDEGKKQDPDSYITSSQILQEMMEMDFILWYAKSTYRPNISQTEIGLWVNEISEMIAPITDVTVNDQYITYLGKLCGSGSLWKKAIEQSRNKKRAESRSIKMEDGKLDMQILRIYGFWEQNGGYVGNNKDNGEYQWSNFTMYPMFHIRDSINPKRMYRVRNAAGYEQIIEMKQEDLISLSKFKLKLEGIGNFIWEATERELIKLKKYLYEKTESAIEVTQMGWQKEGYFAFGNGIFDGIFKPTDEFGIVRMEEVNYYIPSNSKIYKEDASLFQFERTFIHKNYNTLSLHDYAVKLIDVFGDNGKIGLCFLFATLFRDIVVNHTRNFPILNMFGPKGAGKSELGKALMSFFVADNKAPNLQNSTLPALADCVAQCSNALVHLDEFKNNLGPDKFEFLKGLWDGTGRSRMNMDRDKKRETTSVQSGIMVSGQEMATADIALFSRFIYLGFHKTQYSTEEKKHFNVLKEVNNKGVTHLTLEILTLREKVIQGFRLKYEECSADLNAVLENEKVEDRIYRNWLIIYAMYQTLAPYLRLPFTPENMKQVIIAGIRTQNKECLANNELSNFWETVNFLVQEGELKLGYDYRIEYAVKMNTNKVKWEGMTSRPFLLLRRERVFMLYQKHIRQIGGTGLPESTIKYYLENSKEYRGLKNARFKTMKEKDGVNHVFSAPGYANVFDYLELKEQYQFDIEYYTDEDCPPEEQEKEF